MMCEIMNGQNEVILKNATFRDVLAVMHIWLHKDQEIAFSKPEEDGEKNKEGWEVE